MLELSAWISDRADLTIPHFVLCSSAALIVFWIALCRSQHADFSTAEGTTALIQRGFMCVLAIALAGFGSAPIWEDVPPQPVDVLMAGAVLSVFGMRAIRLAVGHDFVSFQAAGEHGHQSL